MRMKPCGINEKGSFEAKSQTIPPIVNDCKRPTIPPKPDKDKITSLPSSSAVIRPTRTECSLGGMRQTVGTQVNMLRKPPPPPTGTSVGKEESHVPRAKPALPPKPRSALLTPQKGYSPQGIKSSVSSSPPPSTPISENIHDKNNRKGEAPVARLVEFENLSDLSLSPERTGNTDSTRLSGQATPPRILSPRNPPRPVPGYPPHSFRFPSQTREISANNNNCLFNNSKPFSTANALFTRQQLNLQPGKNANNSNSKTNPNHKKSTTLPRMNPPDLSCWDSSRNTAVDIPRSISVVPSRPSSFLHPVFFAPETNGKSPPPPPPRLRKRLSIPSPGQSASSPTSPTSQAPELSASSQTPKPVYATVDKEKKWAARQQKQQEQQQKIEDDADKKCLTKDSLGFESEDKQMDSVIKSSLAIAPSWLGRMIEKDVPDNEVGDGVETAHETHETTSSSQTAVKASLENGSILTDYNKLNNPQRENSSAPSECIPCNKKEDNCTVTESCEQGVFDCATDKKFQISCDSNSTETFVLSENRNLCKNESFLFAMQHVLGGTDNDSKSDNTVKNTLSSTDNRGHEHKQQENVVPLSLSKCTDLVNVSSSGNILKDQDLSLTDRSSVQDAFEQDLERRLEASDSAPNKLSSATFSEQDIGVRTLKDKYLKAPDAEYLQYVDCKLESYQHLLETLEKNTAKAGSATVANVKENPVNCNTDCRNKMKDLNSLESTRSEGEMACNLALNCNRFDHKGLHVSENPSSEQNYRPRSWNPSDHSSSESSSSSCNHLHHHGRSCSCRRKKVNSWDDEDELSTGVLGDADSSDAPAPSSTEDIGGEVGKFRKKKTLTNIFGSFGKSGVDVLHAAQQRRSQSQFFVEENLPGEKLGAEEQYHNSTSRHHMSLQRTSGFSSMSSTTSSIFLLSPSDIGQDTDSFSSIGTVTSEVPSVCGESATATTVEVDSSCNVPPHPPPQTLRNDEFQPMPQTRCNDESEPMPQTRCNDESEPMPQTRCNDEFRDILDSLSPKERKSFYVAREILTSEKTFVDVLNLVTIDFPAAITSYSQVARMPVIGSADFDTILGGLPNLKRVNEVLVSELETRISNWKQLPKVADIIVRTGPFLKHYSTYVQDFERIMQRLDDCCSKNPAFAKALKDFESSARCQKLGLKHYMLKPVQRMPQYPLLLDDYLKTLDPNSEDFEDTIKAITIVKEVAEHANEAISIQKNAEKLMDLQNRLPNAVVLKTNRRLLRQGELLKVSRKELQPRFFALMTDCLLCMTYNAATGAPNLKDLKLRYELPLTGMRISLVPSEDYQNEFSVISNTRSFNLVAKDSRERDEWMKFISAAIQDNIKKRAGGTPDMDKEFRIGLQPPVWIHDRRVTMCQVCTTEFTVTFRRHHCRACGKVICGFCWGDEAPLQYRNNAAARVCEDCYGYLLEEFDKENSEKNTAEVNEIRSRFKKQVYKTAQRHNRQRRSIPDKFKIQANDTDSQISGYLQWKREGKAFKKQWLVIKESVLYMFAASADVCAQMSIPILGYGVHPMSSEPSASGEGQLMFKLTHSGQSDLIFQAESSSSAEKWIVAMQEATVLT